MAVFSIVAVPLSYLLFASLLYPDLQLKRTTWKVFFTSMLCSAPFFIILAEIRGGRPEFFSLNSLFFHSLLHEHVVVAAFPAVLYLLFLLFLPLYKGDDEPDSASHKALTFFAGFYSLIVMTDLLMYSGSFDFYRLFLLPCLRIATLITLALGISKFIHETGWRKYLYPLFGFFSTAAAAAASMLYLGNFAAFSLLVTLVILGGSIGAFYFWRKQ